MATRIAVSVSAATPLIRLSTGSAGVSLVSMRRLHTSSSTQRRIAASTSTGATV